MKRYQINENELAFLKDMTTFLSTKGNELSESGEQQLREVFDRVVSRPVFDVEIDPAVFEELNKEQNND